MGQAFSYALETAESEFVRVQNVATAEEAGRAVNYHQLRNMRLPDELAPNTKHVAVLFSIDAGLDGVFSFDDLRNFIGWAADVMPSAAAGGDDFAAQLQARCIFRLWSTVRHSPRGNDIFIDWILLLAERAYPQHVLRPSVERGGDNDGLFGDDDSSVSASDLASSDSSAAEAIDNVSQIAGDGGQGFDGDRSHVDGDGAPLDHVEAMMAGIERQNGASNDVEGERRRFGAAVVSLLYELLQLDAVYGLDFDGFLSLLTGAAGGVDAADGDPAPGEESTCGAEQEEAPEDGSMTPTTTDDDDDDDDGTFFNGGRGSELVGSFETPREGAAKGLPWVAEAPLRAFLDAFAQSMWVTLRRLGLHMLADDATAL
jgi:hypothetical protein